MNWWHFLIGMAALIWPIPVIYWRMADWQDRRAYRRRREHVEELEESERAAQQWATENPY